MHHGGDATLTLLVVLFDHASLGVPLLARLGAVHSLTEEEE